MSRRAAWIWRGAAVLLSALPVIARLIDPPDGRMSFGWFTYEPIAEHVRVLAPHTALAAFLTWQDLTEWGLPVLVAAVPLVVPPITRERWGRPAAGIAALVLALTALAGAYLGVSCGFAGASVGLLSMRGAVWVKPVAYLLAAFALVTARGRARPVSSDPP